MRARPAQVMNRPGPKGAGPPNSRASIWRDDADSVNPLQTGWVEQRSGLIVPLRHRTRRHGPRIVGLIIATVLLLSPVSNGISDVSRAALDFVTLLRLVFSGSAEDAPPTPAPGLDCTGTDPQDRQPPSPSMVTGRLHPRVTPAPPSTTNCRPTCRAKRSPPIARRPSRVASRRPHVRSRIASSARGGPAVSGSAAPDASTR